MRYKITYTDGTTETALSLTQAEDMIKETVTGCDFAATVDKVEELIEDKAGKQIAKERYVEWRCQIH